MNGPCAALWQFRREKEECGKPREELLFVCELDRDGRYTKFLAGFCEE
jgi:hypothetical protein